MCKPCFHTDYHSIIKSFFVAQLVISERSAFYRQEIVQHPMSLCISQLPEMDSQQIKHTVPYVALLLLWLVFTPP